MGVEIGKKEKRIEEGDASNGSASLYHLLSYKQDVDCSLIGGG